MEFWRYYRVVRKRRWLIVIGMIICVGIVAINNQMQVPEYIGRTTLMEQKGMATEGIALFPEQFGQLDLQLRLANLGHIATSQKVLAGAAETLADLGMRFSPDFIVSRTTVEPVRDTNILAIEVRLPDPTEAKVAADVIANEFKKQYHELNNESVRQSREFIEEELKTARKAMIDAQSKLRKFKEANELISIDQEAGVVVNRLSDTKAQLSNAQVTLRALTARRKKIESELASMPEWQTSGQVISKNPRWESLKQQLIQLETTKAAMTAGVAGQPRRGPNHPEVQSIERQIKEAKDKLNDLEPEEVSSTSETRNPLRQNTMDRWVSTKVEEIGAEAQCTALASVLAERKAELTRLPAQEQKLVELTTEVNSTTATYELMRNKLEEARVREQQAKNEASLKIIDPAYVYPVNQRKALKLILALLFSPLLGVGVAFLLHYTDNSIKTAQDAERVLQLPVISVVPNARAHCLPRQRCSEVIGLAYQMFTSNLWIASQNENLKAFAMVSAEPDVGRSVTAANLAVCLAKEGARVVLVDSDLRQPTQHLIFGLDNKVGLTNLLSGAATVEDVLIPTRVQSLLLVPSGPLPENPIKLLRSQEMKEFVEQLNEVADFVIYDTPAGVAFPDAVLVASYVQNAAVVQAAGRVSRGSEMDYRNRLESVGVRMLGAVLNRVRKEDSSGYFHYQRSYAGVGIAQLPGGKKVIKGGG